MRGRYNFIYGLSWGISFAVGPYLAGRIMDNYDPNLLWVRLWDRRHPFRAGISGPALDGSDQAGHFIGRVRRAITHFRDLIS
jgi:hypothetical protein